MSVNNINDYPEFLKKIGQLDDPIPVLRELCKTDLYFLLRYACNRADMEHQWLFDRCREVQESPDGHLDLWSREHYKSTILTFGLSIQEILNNPEVTIGIFSHTRPIAKGFLRQIKREFEGNEKLKAWFPDILYANPAKDATKWSDDDGLIVKRNSNPKESTIEAWGVVESQPTGKHFSILVYDDIVTQGSVSNPDMIEKTTDALAISYNLGAQGGKRRFIGTRYHSNDTYSTIIDRGTVNVRLHPATVDGTFNGDPVFWTSDQLAEKRRDMGPYVFACFAGGTKVLMGDWTQKSIEKIVVGEKVVGYDLGTGRGYKTRLVKTNVIAINSRLADVCEFTFESGRKIVCTPDHKFYTGRSNGRDVGGNDTHLAYVKLGLDKVSLKSAISVYDPEHINAKYDDRIAGWLAGIFDGEGSVSSGAIHISQSPEHNPDVCAKIEYALSYLGFDYGIHNRAGGQRNGCNHKSGRTYYIRGGRQEKIRFLNLVNPVRGYKIIDSLYKQCTKDIGDSMKDKLVSVVKKGECVVYNIQTTTGNYIADGYATKNCQILQSPVQDSDQSFRREWLRYFDGLPPKTINWYLLIDSSSGAEKNGKRSGDYTAIWAIGLSDDGNYYCIPEVRDRINVTERCQRVVELHKKYKPVQVRYEKYGMMIDIDYIKQYQDKINYRFQIVEVGGAQPKPARIKRLIPLFENEKIFLPVRHLTVDYEGKARDNVQAFINEEYMAMPVPHHDDMLDSLSRICDTKGSVNGRSIDLALEWPEDGESSFTTHFDIDKIMRGHDPFVY